MERDLQAELDAALVETARLRRLADSRGARIEAITASQAHNHITRDVKPIGECPGCDTRERLLLAIEHLRMEVDARFPSVVHACCEVAEEAKALYLNLADSEVWAHERLHNAEFAAVVYQLKHIVEGKA